MASVAAVNFTLEFDVMDVGANKLVNIVWRRRSPQIESNNTTFVNWQSDLFLRANFKELLQWCVCLRMPYLPDNAIKLV